MYIGNNDCAPCPAGSFRAEEGLISADQCQPCPTNTFSAALGAMSCTPCSEGTTSGSGAVECAAPPAEVVPETGGSYMTYVAGGVVFGGIALGGAGYAFHMQQQ